MRLLLELIVEEDEVSKTTIGHVKHFLSPTKWMQPHYRKFRTAVQ